LFFFRDIFLFKGLVAVFEELIALLVILGLCDLVLLAKS